MPLFFFRLARDLGPVLAGALVCAMGVSGQVQAQDAWEPQRRRMLEEIAALARETRQDTGRGALSERVMAAMASVSDDQLLHGSSASE